jgi:hypothetical protein
VVIPNDISPRGVLMETQRQPGSDLSGSAGTLFIISDEGQISIGYPCRVVRLKGHSIALEIHKNAAAAFGLYITKDLLDYQCTPPLMLTDSERPHEVSAIVGHAEDTFTSFIPSPHLPLLQDACCRRATAAVLRRGRHGE